MKLFGTWILGMGVLNTMYSLVYFLYILWVANQTWPEGSPEADLANNPQYGVFIFLIIIGIVAIRLGYKLRQASEKVI